MLIIQSAPCSAPQAPSLSLSSRYGKMKAPPQPLHHVPTGFMNVGSFTSTETSLHSGRFRCFTFIRLCVSICTFTPRYGMFSELHLYMSEWGFKSQLEARDLWWKLSRGTQSGSGSKRGWAPRRHQTGTLLVVVVLDSWQCHTRPFPPFLKYCLWLTECRKSPGPSRTGLNCGFNERFGLTERPFSCLLTSQQQN